MSDRAPRTGPVTLQEMAAGVRDEFLQWDRGLIGTFLALAWQPATVVRRYVFERDERHTKPWRYLMFSIVVNVAVTWLALDQLGMRAQMGLTDAGRAAQADFIISNAALLSLIVLPLGAVAMRLFFAGSSVRFVDALVLLFYTQGQANLYALIAFPTLALPHREMFSIALTIAILVYFIWAWASFATGALWRRILAAVVTLVALQALNAAIVTLVLTLVA